MTMRAVIIYESMFGNIMRSPMPSARASNPPLDNVVVVPVVEAGRDRLDDADLLVVGGPTHFHGMSHTRTRQWAAATAQKPKNDLVLDPDAQGPGVRTCSARLATAAPRLLPSTPASRERQSSEGRRRGPSAETFASVGSRWWPSPRASSSPWRTTSNRARRPCPRMGQTARGQRSIERRHPWGLSGTTAHLHGDVMAEVMVPTPGELPSYLAMPAGEGPGRASSSSTTSLGRSQDLRDQADWLAGEGYLAVAPDLFSRRGMVACMISVMRDVWAGRGRSFDDIEAVRSAGGPGGRHGQDRRDRLLHGRRLPLAARRRARVHGVERQLWHRSKGCYMADFLRQACPIVGSYGGKDRTLRGAADRLQRALTAVGVEHDVKEYPRRRALLSQRS